MFEELGENLKTIHKNLRIILIGMIVFLCLICFILGLMVGSLSWN